MLDIGFQELVVVMFVALLVFGPDRLPELGRRLGRAMREFRRATEEMRATIETNLNLHGATPGGWSDVTSASPHPGPSEPVTSAAAPPSDGVPAGAPMADAQAGPAEGAGTLDGRPIEGYARRGGRLLHRRTCPWVGRIPESERVILSTVAEGWDLGLVPCPVCTPDDLRAGHVATSGAPLAHLAPATPGARRQPPDSLASITLPPGATRWAGSPTDALLG